MRILKQISPLALGIIFLFGVQTGCRIDDYEEPIPLTSNYAPTPFELEIPDALPPMLIPDDNPLTVEGVTLGRMLFYDPILSGDSTQSCSSCHNQSYAFTDEGNRLSIGIDGLEGKMNAMALFNLGYAEQFFWNGRAFGLEQQAGMPVEDPLEMHAFWPDVVNRLNDHPTYPDKFNEAFGTSEITRELAQKAIAQFERTIFSGDARYDRLVDRVENWTQEEFVGYQIFFSETGDCFHCHGYDLFTDNDFHNNGLDSVFGPNNMGLYDVTGDPNDIGKFKVPSLRNVAVTAPYMHDGRFNTLMEVVDHYNTGIVESPTLDPLVNKPTRPILDQYQKECLVQFLETLTDTAFLNNPDYGNPFQ